MARQLIMKLLSFRHLKSLLEAEVNFEDETLDNIIDVIKNQKLFPNIFFGSVKQTDDYILVLLNAENPEKAKEELFSHAFAKAANVTLAKERKTKKGGYVLEVFDEDGDAFDKDFYIKLQRGAQFRAGRANELGFLGILENSISKTIEFEDVDGKSIVLKNVEEVRDCGDDPGSRTGNRADFELKYNGGKTFKISLKADSAYKAAGVKNLFKPQAYKIGKIVRQYFIDHKLPYQKHVTVQITNPDLYKWCIFGNDLQKNGAVIQTTVEKAEIEELSNKTIFHVSRLITPNEDVNKLMQEFPFYLKMEVDPRGHVNIVSATFDSFGRKYMLDDLVIPGINEKTVTESTENRKYGIFNGYHIYTDMDDQNIFHTCYKIKDYGIKGTIYIILVSETEAEIQYLDLKWNEEKQGYGPETQGNVCTVHVEYVEYGTWRKRPHGIGMEEIK